MYTLVDAIQSTLRKKEEMVVTGVSLIKDLLKLTWG